jgi:hypothetical protein
LRDEKLLDVATLFHSMLVAYQIALENILGTGRAVFVGPILENFVKINEATGVHMVARQSLDAALQKLCETIKASGLVKDFRLEKLGVRKYIAHVDGCIWAPEIHKNLGPKDLTCPFALMSKSLVQAHSGNRIKCVVSECHEKGTRTRIETME